MAAQSRGGGAWRRGHERRGGACRARRRRRRVDPPREAAAMEQAAPDLERLLQPAPLEPLGHPDAGLEAAVGEEAEGAQDEEGPGDRTVRRGGGGCPACVGA